MNSKSLLILSVIALGLAGAAVWVITSSRPQSAAASLSGGALFPELRSRVNDVTRIRITTADETYTLARTDGVWGLVEKGGYPVSLDQVKSLVVGLSELDFVEEKTASPELFARLDVQDPGSAPDAASRRVELFDANDRLLADLIVGREVTASGGGEPHRYVRRPASGPALEASGRLVIAEGSTDLLDRQIAKLERKRVRDVTITHPDGEVLVVQRPSLETEDFTVTGLPEGAELSWPGVAGGVAGALEYITLEDVRPADESFDTAAATSARFTTFDGLVVVAHTLEQEGKLLLRVRAEYDESARQPEPVGPPPAEGQETAPVTPPAPIGKTPEEVRAEAESINARAGKWTYVVPGYAGSNLRKHQSELLKQPEDAPADPFDLGEDPSVPPQDGAGAPAQDSQQPTDEQPAANPAGKPTTDARSSATSSAACDAAPCAARIPRRHRAQRCAPA
jgi:hypothetical protein